MGPRRDHLYLATTLSGLLTVALCWWIARAQRRMILASGAACVPFFPLAGTYNDGSFWTPTHLEVPYLLPMNAFGGPVGLEDMMCLFIAGARAWFFATLPAQRQWVATAAPAPFLRRAAVVSVTALAACAILRALGFGYLAISFLVPSALGLVILIRRPGYWRLALAGAVGSAALSALELRVYFILWPEWPSAWPQGVFTSAEIFGVKVGDVIWWSIFGAVHPLVMAHCAGAVRTTSTTGNMPR